MYKAKLQELCHQRKWGLPRYSAMKDGPDHMPSFKASVYVNRVTFTSGAFSSLKEAHNQAAMLAFFSYGSSTPTAPQETKEQIGMAKPQEIPIPAQSSDIIDAMDRLCKNQLQKNAPKINLDPPVLICKTEDLPSACHFKATVLANGKSLESPAFFNSINEVEQAAAKLDLMSLSHDISEKGDSDSFKTSLLKLTQREGFHEPTYKTTQAGSPHMSTFFSTVEVEGVDFHGKGGRSKKQAEEDAAMIAYIALKECGLNMYAAISPAQTKNKAAQLIHNSDNVKCIQNLKLEDEIVNLDLNETLLANVSNEVHDSSCKRVSDSSPKSSPL